MVRLAITLVLVLAASARPGPLSARQVTPDDRATVAGRVIVADGMSLRGAIARLGLAGIETEAPIHDDGTFRFEHIQPSTYELQIATVDSAPFRLKLIVPRAATLALPAISLPPPVFIRVRLVSPRGDPIVNPGIITQSYDVDGRMIAGRAGERIVPQTDAEGVTSIGPLSRGVLTLVIDAPPWAPARLPEVLVRGQEPTIDLGTVRLAVGASLDVDVIDGAGAPVANRFVSLEQDSPLGFRPPIPVLTGQDGRARFDRLAEGRYRVRTLASRSCGLHRPMLERRVTISAGAVVRQVLSVAGVSLSIHLNGNGAPLTSAAVSIAPDVAEPAPPSWFHGDEELWKVFGAPRYAPNEACGDTTDARGDAVIRYVPSGPARVSVQFANSTYVRRAVVPIRDGRLTLDVPQGVAALRVIDARSGEPVVGAAMTWASAGGEVHARVPATGDVLLEGVSDAPGDLVVRRQGFRPFRAAFAAPPPVLYTVSLEPTPDTRIRVRVKDEAGKPVPGAVVHLVPADELLLEQFAGTDERGLVQFSNVAEGRLKLSAMADGDSSDVLVTTVPTTPENALLFLTLKAARLPAEARNSFGTNFSFGSHRRQSMLKKLNRPGAIESACGSSGLFE